MNSETQLKTGAGTVVGYTYNADVHCVDCTQEFVNESDDPELLAKYANGSPTSMTIEGFGTVSVSNPESIPHPVFYDSEWDGQPHCGNGSSCVNATTNHAYRHDLPVGQPILCTVLDYVEDLTHEDPTINRDDDDVMAFEIHGSIYTYAYEFDKAGDELVYNGRQNRGTTEYDNWGDAPDVVQEAAEDLIKEGKEAGAL